ncbi:unnamed protein product [Arabis nemorensis]|uniref:Uncharacterized protein n=1 Tax=Arabis nemorensis TaxID=586526 RepID=A0A565CCE6_9BRAS|nr:unnamed protein product [Arabis nemorensis]
MTMFLSQVVIVCHGVWEISLAVISKDQEFVIVVASIQFRDLAESVQDGFYKLSHTSNLN